MPVKHLFAFDVDQTLLPAGQMEIPSKEVEAINKKLKEGHAVAIASGRPAEAIWRYLDSFIEGEKYAIAYNGALVYSPSHELIGHRLLDLEDLYYVKRLFPEECYDVYAYLEDGRIACFKPGKYVGLEIKLNLLPSPLIVPAKMMGDAPSIKVAKVMIGADPAVSRTIDFADPRYDTTRSSPVFFEILRPGVDKAKGVGFVKEHCHAQEAYCFGDELNDLGMIGAFHGVAMGNAVSKVKEAAEIITKPCAMDGVAYAINHLLPL